MGQVVAPALTHPGRRSKRRSPGARRRAVQEGAMSFNPQMDDDAKGEVIHLGANGGSARWGLYLVIFMRITAALWLIQGLLQWRIILAPEASPLDAMPSLEAAAVVFFAITNLLAAVGPVARGAVGRGALAVRRLGPDVHDRLFAGIDRGRAADARPRCVAGRRLFRAQLVRRAGTRRGLDLSRYCERSEAIHIRRTAPWIACVAALLATTSRGHFSPNSSCAFL